MTENAFYALNQKRPRHIASEELKVIYARKVRYNKNFRKKSIAIKIRVEYQFEK